MKPLFKLAEEFYELCITASESKVYGPYTKSNGRQIVIVRDETGTHSTISYPKYIMEQHLGRKLDINETIDHINKNINDNDILNLRILPRAEHSALDTRRVVMLKLKCALCGKEFERSPRRLREKSKSKKVGPFCSRSCAGMYGRKLQLKLIKKKFKLQKHKDSEYYTNKQLDK